MGSREIDNGKDRKMLEKQTSGRKSKPHTAAGIYRQIQSQIQCFWTDATTRGQADRQLSLSVTSTYYHQNVEITGPTVKPWLHDNNPVLSLLSLRRGVCITGPTHNSRVWVETQDVTKTKVKSKNKKKWNRLNNPTELRRCSHLTLSRQNMSISLNEPLGLMSLSNMSGGPNLRFPCLNRILVFLLVMVFWFTLKNIIIKKN